MPLNRFAPRALSTVSISSWIDASTRLDRKKMKLRPIPTSRESEICIARPANDAVRSKRKKTQRYLGSALAPARRRPCAGALLYGARRDCRAPNCAVTLVQRQGGLNRQLNGPA